MAPGIMRDVTKSILICIIGIMIQCCLIRRVHDLFLRAKTSSQFHLFEMGSNLTSRKVQCFV